MVQIDVPGKPRRSRGVPGSIFGLISQTAFRYPVLCCRAQRLGPLWRSEGPGHPSCKKLYKKSTPGPLTGQEALTTTLPGYLKAVWLKIFGPVFLGFRPKIDPGTPLDRRGLPGTSICTKNQPRRPIRGPNGGERKIPTDCLQVPRLTPEQNCETTILVGFGAERVRQPKTDKQGHSFSADCRPNLATRPL